jgi:hypothetical protein
MGGASDEKTSIIFEVSQAISAGSIERAADIMRKKYPFVAIEREGRRYSRSRAVKIFRRDGFVDRYSGRRLVFPGSLWLISRRLGQGIFPYDAHWAMNRCHIAYYELFPVLDHVKPIARGGEDTEENLVTTSTLRNSAKANFLLEELGWRLLKISELNYWDGLTGWFVDMVKDDDDALEDPFCGGWFAAANDPD